MTGLFVVFEGGDGVGKSTQTKLLAEWATGQGLDVRVTFEPGDTAAGQLIRRIVLDPATGELDPRAEALLYAADKAHHLYEVVRPALARGELVEILSAWRPAPYPFHVVYARHRHVPPRLRVFIEWLAAVFPAAVQG